MPARDRFLLPALLLLAAATAWWLHARAWDLGGRSPLLNYDSAQYALAGRTLAQSGRLASDYALPIELARHARPPWPLAVVQPGPVVLQGALFALAGPRETLVLVVPALGFLAVALLLYGAGLRVAGPLGAATAALAFILDPEAQHFASGGFTEIPFALGLCGALAALAAGAAARRPLLFGLLLGAAGSFRAQMTFFLPVLALAAAWSAPAERRPRVTTLVVLGFAVALAPWWLYKWRAFGSPAWDLTRLVMWEGVDGNTWFSLLHRPEMPLLPSGMEALRKLAAKALGNLPALGVALTVGVRGMLLVALLAALAGLRPPRAVALAGWSALLLVASSTLLAAVSIPWTRLLFPARVAAEAAGLWALLALAQRVPRRGAPSVLRGTAVALVLLWGVFQFTRGLAEAREVSARRGLPGAAALRELARRLDAECAPHEIVMSNLGPVLAWYARRPVVHLALSPADLRACRERVELRHVVLVFRDAQQAWSEWRAIVERGARAPLEPEWEAAAVKEARTRDGFKVVWLVLRPRPAPLAVAAARVSAPGVIASVKQTGQP